MNLLVQIMELLNLTLTQPAYASTDLINREILLV